MQEFAPPERPPEQAVYKNHITIRGMADLMALEAPKWQIPELVPAKSLVTLYGGPGVGKSFLALDFCLSIALGEPWQGRPVEQGPTLYLACEGIAGIPKRVGAWLEHRGLSIPKELWKDVPFYYTTGFTDLRGQGPTTDLIRALEHDLESRGKGLELVVLDTLSRSLGGGADENSASEMNMALDQLERIRQHTDATVMILHHTNKNKTAERGSTVLRGACDTMLLLQDNESHILLTVDKQRDWEEATPLPLYFQSVGEGDMASAVLTTEGPKQMVLGAKERQIYKLICELYNGVPMSYTQLLKATEESESSFLRIVKNLTTAGMLARSNGKRGGYYPVTEETKDKAPTDPEESTDDND
jgi:hypothetical protein